MPIVRFTQVVIADCVDPKTGRVYSHLAALDREGRIWESFAGMDGGTLKMVPSPVETKTKRQRGAKRV